MVTALEKLEKERDSAKTIIEWLETKLANHAVQPLTEAMVDLFIQQANASYAKVNDTFDKIVACHPADMDPHNLEHLQLLDKVQPVLWGLQAIKATFLPVHVHPPPPPPGPKNADIRLPRLELPTFDGNIQNWISFHDMFTAAIHNSTVLTKCQKLSYLKSSLTGEAARQIKSLTVTEDNYDIAWTQLSDRYNNERELLFSVMRRFIGQAVLPGNSAAALRTMIDVSKECVRSIGTLKLPVDQGDAILLFMIFSKLDQQSREIWEQSLTNSDIPSLKDFLEFLEQRARALAAGGSIQTRPANQVAKADQGGNHPRKVAHAHHANTTECKLCKDSHNLFRCPKFLALTVPERYETVKKLSLCFNCLQHGHSLSRCTSSGTCRTCGKKHNSLLHKEPIPATIIPKDTVALNHHSNDEVCIQQTMLATAVVMVQDHHGQYQPVRALMDGGSNANFITDSCLKSLGLQRHYNKAEIRGLSSISIGTAKGAANLVACSRYLGKESYSFEALIMPRVTSNLPIHPCDTTVWPHLQGLDLADPNYHTPAPIDLLLGADVFYNSILEGKRMGPDNSPVAVKTSFGWIIAGNLNAVSTQVSVHHADAELNNQLQQFWEIETISTTRTKTKEEEKCESHFIATHKRDDNGRFIVQLPFNNNCSKLGASRDIAIRRLKQLEARFNREPARQQQYIEFMNEYIALGHMQEVGANVNSLNSSKSEHATNMSQCYIPHHYVIKESSMTTKLRVVFDASAKTTSGVSLNDTLMVGPTIQDTLTDILMRFRTHPIALVADITKMYRQFLVHPLNVNNQRILWRDHPSKPIKDYKLMTVTYGTASAPFLATRSLQQLAIDGKESFPLAYNPTMKDFYVDNLMTGADTVENGLKIQQQIINLMKEGGMELRQWSSNSSEILSAVPVQFRDSSTTLSIDVDQTVKTLGVYWNPVLDQFCFKVTLGSIKPGTHLTKRILLSEIAKIFDPLGWLGPIIIKAKILLQKLWELKLGWDDNLPINIEHEWYEFRNALILIEQISIPRCIVTVGFHQGILVGFCDASEKAYAAVVYLCTFRNDLPVNVSQISSKTRVSPSKQVSLPRLELCGALLLSQLMFNIQKALNIPINSLKAFTDSTVVLAWIQAHPSRWKTFVANRVTEIQSIIPGHLWGHVKGIENPADCASRGLDPSELETHTLWWNGPTWLSNDHHPVCESSQQDDDHLVQSEAKPVVTCNCILSTHLNETILSELNDEVICATAISYDQSLIHKYSSLRTLTRVTALLRRFINNTLIKIQQIRNNFPCKQLQHGPLTTQELDEALQTWVRIVQQEEFQSEITKLEEDKPLPHKSKILTLNPFMDANNILRVGGRLHNAPMHSKQRHPMLLPRHHAFTQLIIMTEHLANLHAGPQLLLSIIHKRFWILGARDAIKHQIKKCVPCARNSAALQQQFMGNLPTARVTPTKPFLRCGIDYAGPFSIRPISPRSKITHKAYLAVFVCFSTHAIHLEVVSELSTPAFIAALHRFVSRRGKPKDIHSDCGTNFIGAARELKEATAMFQSASHNDEVANRLSSEGIQWHFNPPGAPHFGGLWEAGVKSVKYHLRRVVGTARLTFEEFSTVMCQIEACLNSRPLTPVSTDPSDLEALTPGHFLIGAPLTAIPEINLTDTKMGRLNRWQLIQHITQHFWQRWANEFISRQQQRPKWMKQRSNIKINDMVIIKDDNVPPLEWRLGRIIQTHPGKDGLVRVATIKTALGDIKRPITKLCLLPMDPSSSVCDAKQ